MRACDHCGRLLVTEVIVLAAVTERDLMGTTVEVDLPVVLVADQVAQVGNTRGALVLTEEVRPDMIELAPSHLKGGLSKILRLSVHSL